jgi:hypothetical protein
MPLDEPYPELEELLTTIGEAGRRVKLRTVVRAFDVETTLV